MSKNRIKNLSFSIFCVIILVCVLLSRFSIIGLAGFALAAGGILLVALAYDKEQNVVGKIDLYILLAVFGVLAVHYDQLINSFDGLYYFYWFDENLAARIIAVIAGPILGLIFNSIAQNRYSITAAIVNKFIGMFLMVMGISIFFFGGPHQAFLAQIMLLHSLYGVIAFCRANRAPNNSEKSPSRPYLYGNDGAVKRPVTVSFWLSILLLIISILSPSFRLTELTITAFLSQTILPWYSVLGITLLLSAIVGMGLFYGKNILDEDTMFLTGIIGLAWVVKAATCFDFYASWLAICIYALLFFGFINRFTKRKKAGKLVMLTSKLSESEFYWLLIAAASLVISVIMVYIGYLYVWLALVVCIPFVLFTNRMFKEKWVKDAVFWISLLIGIAVTACMVCFERGGMYIERIRLISAMLGFGVVAMWMLNHRNRIGQNKFKVTKIAMAVAFSLIAIIAAFR